MELAERIGAEIVSMDSMALYRHMDIGTAKPSPAERSRVPHHLIDVIDPHEEYSLAQYIEAAHRCAEDITGRGKKVLFVGGTPLYLKGLLRGIFQGPPADWTFRRQLQQESQQQDPLWLHRQLQRGRSGGRRPIASQRYAAADSGVGDFSPYRPPDQ